MSQLRSPHVLPFALLGALVAACSSSSSPLPTETPDTGTGQHDTGAPHVDAGGGDSGKHDGGVVTEKDTGAPDVVAPTEAGPTGPVPPSTAKSVATGLIDVLGITSDGYLVYYDTTGAVKASDSTGNITTVAPAADAGAEGYVGNVTGQYVWLLSDYSTIVSGGTTTPVAGTLSVWSHTLGTLTKIAENSTGIVNIATDGSYIVYTDNSNAAGKVGNIGIVGASGTGGMDVLKDVVIDSSSITCAPLAAITKGAIITSSCAVTNDAGTEFAANVITSFATPGYAPTVILTEAAPDNPSGGTGAPESVNIATDTVGDTVLTVAKSGPTLAAQGVASTTANTILTPFTAPVSGANTGLADFYLAKDASFAIFTQPNAHLGLATFTPPSAVPTVTTPNGTDIVLGVVTVSPDDNWDLDYSTPLDTGLGGYPTSLAIRNIKTGASNQLIPAGSGDVGTFVSTFTDDVSYVFFTTGLVSVGSGATVGGLTSAPVGTGVANVLEGTGSKVWNATSVPTVAKAIIYNKNYATITLDSNIPNGDATADMYIVSADQDTTTTPPTLLVTGADAPNYFYITPDGKYLFFTFSQVTTVDGGLALFSTDGLYVMPIPTP